MAQKFLENTLVLLTRYYSGGQTPCSHMSMEVCPSEKMGSMGVGIVRIVLHVMILYGFYRLGNWMKQLFHLFIPGSVIGMVLLFILLATGALRVRWIESGLQFMVGHLSLFFIPATIGIMNYLDMFQGKGILLIFIVLASTVMVMAVSGLTSQWLVSVKEKQHGLAGDSTKRGEEQV